MVFDIYVYFSTCFVKNRYAELLDDPKNSHIDREIASQFLEMYMKFECSYTAADSLSDISGFGYCTYLETEGNQHLSWKDKGFSTLLDILMVNICRLNGSQFKVLI